jgi:hypothetical protein
MCTDSNFLVCTDCATLPLLRNLAAGEPYEEDTFADADAADGYEPGNDSDNDEGGGGGSSSSSRSKRRNRFGPEFKAKSDKEKAQFLWALLLKDEGLKIHLDERVCAAVLLVLTVYCYCVYLRCMRCA